MSDETGNFCPYCGARIPANTQFCTSCGASLNTAPERNVGYSGTYSNTAPYDTPKKGSGEHGTRLIVVSVFAVILALIGLYIGLTSIVNVDAVINSIDWSTIELPEGTTVKELKDMMAGLLVIIGWLFLISGITGVVGAVCGFTKKLYALGLICYIVATVVTAITVIGLIIGIILTVLYSTSKTEFC